ncbi:MAG TPA: alpha/beta hydrolase [Pseudonocardia sp.]|jgi:pimeloyl-ACP methyl ester carboxylesterase|nr:alpha/beta hydrolase [Pseudonocardia sp.]
MRSEPVDGFRLTYDRAGSGPPVVLLHGWPGDRTDYRHVVQLLTDHATVVVPDLRGFGESDRRADAPADAYAAAAQAESLAALIEELGLDRPVVVGYDVGSRAAQTLARQRPDLLAALIVGPPLPGVGRRVLEENTVREFWYQHFHRSSLIEELIDGRPDAVRTYLAYIWGHWSGPAYTPAEADLDHLVEVYGAPGAFTASVAWYRSGSGTVARSLAEVTPEPVDRLQVPTTVLWPEHDPLFPREWSDRLSEFLADFRLRPVDGIGHFLPLEAPALLAEEIVAELR